MNPVSAKAYADYLRGRFFSNGGTKEGLEKALEHYRMVVADSTGSALGYAGIADTYILQANHGFLRPQEAAPLAKEAALKAIEIDDTPAEAYSALRWPGPRCSKGSAPCRSEPPIADRRGLVSCGYSQSPPAA